MIITNDRLKGIASGTVPMALWPDHHEVKAISTELLAKRKGDGDKPRAQYWRHGKDGLDGFMTIDGKIVAVMDAGMVHEASVITKSEKITCSDCLKNEITADEWVAIQRNANSPLSVAGEGAARILGVELPPVVEAKSKHYLCPHCHSPILWSEDRGAHCDGCDEFDEEKDLPTPPAKPEPDEPDKQRCNHCMEIFNEEYAACPNCGRNDALMFPFEEGDACGAV